MFYENFTVLYFGGFVARFEAPVARWCDNATVGHPCVSDIIKRVWLLLAAMSTNRSTIYWSIYCIPWNYISLRLRWRVKVLVSDTDGPAVVRKRTGVINPYLKPLTWPIRSILLDNQTDYETRLCNITARPYKVKTTLNQGLEKEERIGLLHWFHQLSSYHDKIETRNRKEIPFSSWIFPRGLSVQKNHRQFCTMPHVYIATRPTRFCKDPAETGTCKLTLWSQAK